MEELSSPRGVEEVGRKLVGLGAWWWKAARSGVVMELGLESGLSALVMANGRRSNVAMMLCVMSDEDGG